MYTSDVGNAKDENGNADIEGHDEKVEDDVAT